jgi:hypothetical protein
MVAVALARGGVANWRPASVVLRDAERADCEGRRLPSWTADRHDAAAVADG